jgi:hypothetical protein
MIGYHENADPPYAMIRHDIDLSPPLALPLAVVENALSIKTTYCFMVRSSAYNLFSKGSAAVVQKLLDLGHLVGLHFDCDSYPSVRTPAEIAAAVRVEVGMLEKWFGLDVSMVSFHKPNQLILGGSQELTDPLPHAYMGKFLRGSAYFSDSYGFWRFGHPLRSNAFKDRKPLSLCCHPVWWGPEPTSPLLAMREVALQKKEDIRQYMLTNIVGV